MIRQLKVCLNGGRSRAEHPAVPVTPAELARAAVDAVAAGAEAVHLHPRDSTGRESLAGDNVAAAVSAVRLACPGIPVGVSTGLWIAGWGPGARQSMVEGWAGLAERSRPHFASVNLGEAGSVELVGTLHRAGVVVEVGVWSIADTQVLAGLPGGCVARVLVEVLDTPAEQAVAVADGILARLDPGTPVLLHGAGEACWPLVAHAGRLGLPTRIGLEDTLVGPTGEPVRDNAELVRLALARWRS